jgi:hypothetical protein
MEQYIIAARLKPGNAVAAEEMLATGPPFDPSKAGLTTHAAYLTADEVYLLFEGETARTTALQVARDHPVEVSRWQAVVSGLPFRVAEVPRDARCVYEWKAEHRPPAQLAFLDMWDVLKWQNDTLSIAWWALIAFAILVIIAAGSRAAR